MLRSSLTLKWRTSAHLSIVQKSSSWESKPTRVSAWLLKQQFEVKPLPDIWIHDSSVKLFKWQLKELNEWFSAYCTHVCVYVLRCDWTLPRHSPCSYSPADSDDWCLSSEPETNVPTFRWSYTVRCRPYRHERDLKEMKNNSHQILITTFKYRVMFPYRGQISRAVYLCPL